MWARRAASVLAVVATLTGCGGTEIPTPAPASVAPARGFAASDTPVVISGSGFSVLTVQSSSGGEPSVDETFQAWLGGQALLDVRRVDESTLSATVPAGLAPGPYSLRVQGPFGTAGELAAAFTVEGSAQESLTAAIAAAPATVSVGQSITVTLTVTNSTTAAAEGVVPSVPVVTGSATVAVSTGPLPASVAALAPGASETFTWIYQSTGAGSLAFAGGASATDSFSGLTVNCATDPARPATVTVQAQAGLSATLTPARTPAVPTGQPFTVNVGQVFTLTLAVSNTGAAAANAVTPTPITGCAAPSPASATVSPGTPVAFLYANCSSATAGSLAFSASASGTDGNGPSLAVTTNTATASVTVQAPAAVTGALSIPSGIARGFPFNVTLTLTNSGGAPAVVTPGALAVAAGSTGAANLVTGPTPTSVTVPGGGSAGVQWTYNATSAGSISFTGSATGIDSNTGAAVPAIAVPASNVGTIGQGGLAISMVVSPSTATIGQQVLFTMTVTNGGTAAVNDIVPSLALSGATGTLGAPLPASLASLGTTAPGNTGTFTWTFTSTTSGPVSATASVTGTDALSLAPVTASTVANNILQVQATLGGTITGLTGTGLQLATAGEPNLVLQPGATTFTFAVPLISGTAYAITVAAQPTAPSQTCTVTSGGTGTIGSGNIGNVAVTCVTNGFTLGGTITGLTGTGLQLATAGEPNLDVVPGATTFAFVAPLIGGTAYAVTVAAQPTAPSQTCSVTSGGTGTIGTANVSDVVVTCVTNTFTVGGTVTGLSAGASVVLQNNGADALTVLADGTFTFVTPVASGGTYLVTVLRQPASPPQTCAVTAGTGQVTGANIGSVVVTCGYTIGGTVTGLANAGGVVLQNKGGDDLTVPQDGAFTFATPVPSGGTYLVTVLRQPTAPAQICTVTGGSGPVTSANVESVLVTCIR